MYRRIEQQAGFIEFAQLNFDEARDLFVQGQLDVREVCHYLRTHSVIQLTRVFNSVTANSTFIVCCGSSAVREIIDRASYSHELYCSFLLCHKS